jgi:hypothetical protein
MCDTYPYDQFDLYKSDLDGYDTYPTSDEEDETTTIPPKLDGILYRYARSLQNAIQHEITTYQSNLLRLDDTYSDIQVTYSGDDSPLVYGQNSFSPADLAELESRLACLEYQNGEMCRHLDGHHD